MESFTGTFRSSATLWIVVGASDRGEEDVDVDATGPGLGLSGMFDLGGKTWMMRARYLRVTR